MSEGIAVLLGAVVGGCCSLIGTYFTLRFQSKMEIKKLTLSFLLEKKGSIERLIDHCSSFDYVGDMEQDERTIIDEFKVLKGFICRKSHYFIESVEFQKLQKSLFDISNDEYSSPLHDELSFNNSTRKFMQAELEVTMKHIAKQLRQ